jgi:predicted protein tyrosine phosphatase
MPWIQNVSLADVQKGHHIRVSENSMLIQIVDPDMKFPTPKYQFKETYQFQFLDIEEDGLTNFGDGEMVDVSSMAVKDQDAEQLVNLLKHALDNRMDVVVHCHAGVCRSGAVAEVGVMMGFDDAEAFRSPNLLVKHKMMRLLGWTYDAEEPHTINGYTTESGVILPKTVDWANDNEKVFTLAAERRERRQREGDI